MSQKVNTCLVIPQEILKLLIYKDFLFSPLLNYVVLLRGERE